MRQFEYQQAGTEFLQSHPRCVLADEPGLGKTNQALMAAVGRTLVVAPAAFEQIWRREAAEWSDQLDPSFELSFTSYHKLCRRNPGGSVLPELREEWRGRWDTVIFDEAHYLKDRKVKWTQAALTLKTDRLFMLTGTPIPNWSHELFCLIRMLHPGDVRFRSYWRWVEQWFVVWQPPWGGHQIQGLRAGHTWEDFAHANGLVGRWLRRERDEVLRELPPLITQTIDCQMGGAQKRVYRQLKDECYALLESGAEILAWSSGGMYTKLHKLSTGVEVEDPSTRSSCKLDMVDSIMEERRQSHTLILCRFRSTVEQVRRRLERSGIDCRVITGAVAPVIRESIVSEFQGGGVPALVATIDTIAEGFTLTQADCVVFVERHPRPSKNEQARRRIHRIGQTRPCLQIDLVTRDSVDSRLLELLQSKTDEQMTALGAFDLL